MKCHTFIVSLLLAFGCSAQPAVNVNENQQIPSAKQKSTIAKSNWIHGSPDCDNINEPANDVYKHDEQTIIIRQNKCLTFEAPFIYILVGKHRILVLDTGAINDNPEYSLRAEIENVLSKELFSSKEVLVVHSHGHSDHYQGDSSFEGLSNVKLIKPSATEVYQYFGFTGWPQGQATIELGDRQLTVIPTPGHQEEAITIFDHKTKWLLTGDTLYPGYIYVKDWDSYRNSIDKLATFASHNEITAILGAHIEMKKQPACYYPIGSTYQPNEAQLDLSVQSLHNLNTKLKDSNKPIEIIFDNFIIKPMSGFQKTLSNVVRWFAQ